MPKHPTLTAPQIARLRLQSLGLVGAPVAKEPTGIVRHHLAMQAQDFKASRWAVGSRLPGSTDGEVLAAYDAGTLVRSWPMRGTVHVVAAEDLHWMMELMGKKALAGVKRRWEFLGIVEGVMERAREVAIQLLSGGGRCTRKEWGIALEEAGLDLRGMRSYHTIWYLSQTGTLVQGPTREGEQELVLMDEWIAHPRQFTRDEALRELGVRYLQARGPATVEDLTHWSGLGKIECRRALAPEAGVVEVVDGPGGPYYLTAGTLDRLNPDSPEADAAVLALAAFDEHLLGYRVRDAVLDPTHATLVDPGRNGVFRWTLVAKTQVVGTWKRTPRARRTVLDVTPFARISARTQKAALRALERWGAFAGREVEVRWVEEG
jgi:hypothetical protein